MVATQEDSHSPLGTAIVGYGYWGNNLARNVVSSDKMELVAIADSNMESRSAASVAYPSTRIYTDVHEVLEDKDVSAVILSTPAGTHGKMAVDVLSGGRHVLVEKPLAMDLEGAYAVRDAAIKSGKVAMVGHTFLYSPPVRKLKELIESGTLGNIQYIYSQRLNLGRIRADCDALWNFGPHDISIAAYLLDSFPKWVSATSFMLVQSGIADVAFGTLGFPSGVGMHMHVSWMDPRKVRQMTVVGDEKMVVYDDVAVDAPIQIYDSGVAASPSQEVSEYASFAEHQWKTRAGDVVLPRIHRYEPLAFEMSEFAQACKAGTEPLANGEHGSQVVAVLEAMSDSTRAGGMAVHLEQG